MELNSYFQLEKGLGKKKIIFGIVKKCIEQCFSTGVPWNLFGCAPKTYHIPERGIWYFLHICVPTNFFTKLVFREL